MTDDRTPPVAPQALPPPPLLDLALAYHKTVEGEYGCPGATCPGVQRLVVLLESAVDARLVALRAERDDLVRQYEDLRDAVCTYCGDGRELMEPHAVVALALAHAEDSQSMDRERAQREIAEAELSALRASLRALVAQWQETAERFQSALKSGFDHDSTLVCSERDQVLRKSADELTALLADGAPEIPYQPESTESTARLIAAAPDLLAALKALMTADTEEQEVAAVYQADQSIAKAEGRADGAPRETP